MTIFSYPHLLKATLTIQTSVFNINKTCLNLVMCYKGSLLNASPVHRSEDSTVKYCISGGSFKTSNPSLNTLHT